MKTKLTFFLFILPYLTFAQVNCFEIIDLESIISITDDDENIYCGTEEHGLVRINKSTFTKTYWNTSNSNISNNRIKSVLNYNDKIYISSDSSLMFLEDATIYNFNDSIEGLLAENIDGNLLVAGRRDFYIMNPMGDLIYHQNLMEIVNDECCSQITDIDIDSDNNIWLSHYDFYEFDIFKFDGNTWTVFDRNNSNLPAESFTNNQITTRDNHIYATCWGGAFEFESNDWNLIPSIENSQENINGLYVLAIEADENNVLWVGANSINNTLPVKIGFQINDDWYFVKNDNNAFPKINMFKESITDANILYAGTNEGLIILDKNCLISIATDTKEIAAHEKISIYPIPSKDILNIISELEIKQIEFYDINGRLLLQKESPKNMVDISTLSVGTYVLKIHTRNNVFTKNIIKE